MRLYELGYQKPRPPVPTDFQGIADPLTATLPSQALAELAATCGVRQYTMDAADHGGFGRIPSAYLYLDPAKLSDVSFNCLSERLRPPYLNLHIFERCRSIIEKNSGAPPCQEALE